MILLTDETEGEYERLLLEAEIELACLEYELGAIYGWWPKVEPLEE